MLVQNPINMRSRVYRFIPEVEKSCRRLQSCHGDAYPLPVYAGTLQNMLALKVVFVIKPRIYFYTMLSDWSQNLLLCLCTMHNTIIFLFRCIPYKYRDSGESSDENLERIVEVLMINSPSGPGLLFPKVLSVWCFHQIDARCGQLKHSSSALSFSFNDHHLYHR